MLSLRRTDPLPIKRIFSSTSFHDVLQLDASAAISLSLLKTQYRKIALDVHPDKNAHPRAHEAFQMLNLAFENLCEGNAGNLKEEKQPKRPVYSQSRSGTKWRQHLKTKGGTGPTGNQRDEKESVEDEIKEMERMVKEEIRKQMQKEAEAKQEEKENSRETAQALLGRLNRVN